MSKEMIILQLPEKMRQEDHGFKFSTMMDSEIRFLKGKDLDLGKELKAMSGPKV